MEDSDAPSDVAVGRQMQRYTRSVVSFLTENVQVEDEFTNSLTLFGRDEQARLIFEAYERVSDGVSEVIMLHGESGTGKSSLVESTRGFITKHDRGYFVSGKYDQLQTTKEPFSAVAAAFSDICDLLLQSDQLDEQRASIMSALGPSGGDILSRVVSNITLVMGEDCDEKELASMHTEDFIRFKLACQQFLRAVATKKHPILIFFDDVQWADEMSIKLMKALMSDEESEHVLFCVAYRSNDVDGIELLDLSATHADHLTFTEIKVGNLEEEDLCSLLTQLLQVERTVIAPLSCLLMKKTAGNPNTMMQILQLLKTKGLLCYSDEAHSWTWNIHAIESEISDNPAEIVAQKIESVGRDVEEILQLASFIGHTFRTNVLCCVVNQGVERVSRLDTIDEEKLRQALLLARDNGIVVQSGTDSFKFTHDSSQHYLHSSVEDMSELIHLRIARGLVHMISRNSTIEEGLLLLAASNMIRGAMHIVDDDERLLTMQLFLDAATLAASKASVGDAKEYLMCAVGLEKPSYYSTHYRLCIDLQNMHAEILSCDGCFVECDQVVDTVLSHSESMEDTLRAQCTKIRSLASRKRYEEVVDFTFNDILSNLGIKIRTNPSRLFLISEMIRTKLIFRKMKPTDLLSLPAMVDERIVAATKVLFIISPIVFNNNQPLLAHCASLLSLRLAVKHGICPMTAYALSGYAISLVHIGKVDDAFQLGKVAGQLASRSSMLSVQSVCLAILPLFVYCWREKLMDLADMMHQSYLVGMKSSADVSVAYYGLHAYLEAQLHLGAPLAILEDETRDHCRRMKELQALRFLSFRLVSWQNLLNLLGQSDDPAVLTGEILDENEVLQACERDGDTIRAGTLHLARLDLQVSFEEWALVEETVPLVEKGLPFLTKSFMVIFATATIAMASLALFERKGKRKYRTSARRYMKIMAKWCRQNVPDAEPLLLLIQAEWMAVVKKDESSSAFDDAIEALKKNQLVVFETMAYQRAMHQMLRRMNVRKAREYLTTSLERHEEWGNVAKLEWLEKNFSEILMKKRPAFEVRMDG